MNRDDLGRFKPSRKRQEMIQYCISAIKNGKDADKTRLEMMDKFDIRMSTAMKVYSETKKHINQTKNAS